ncbi:MAG TPA: nitrite/sulfite reductase [Pyrinomonadaceae bacterium]|nr:nitrite/sulfite reductase [Pyrinomonadaceae bacterium]
MQSTPASKSPVPLMPAYVEDELAWYEDQIKKYRAGELDETKMQKVRLHFGTYAQRQQGVQMQRIKIPGGHLTSTQLTRLADAADQFGSGFMHLTTREDAQIYYVSLDETPNLLRFLAKAGITTREACGNTVRNITACYRAGTSATEPFDVTPYARALFRYLVRNKFNQNLGRKFKITFEGCAEDHSSLRINDIGFWAATRQLNEVSERGFRVYLGGGLGSTPHLARLYTEFLPADEIFNFAAALLRLFDRYGERKARMKARLKFLIQSMGWDDFVAALEAERDRVGHIRLVDHLPREDDDVPPGCNSQRLELHHDSSDPEFRAWIEDSVIAHKQEGFRGVHVRLKLGDITSDRARRLAEIARRFSAGQLRTSIGQNIYLPWVRQHQLANLYLALRQIELDQPGVDTIRDVTACPGSDTCRLGIASAKGLGNAISEAFENGLGQYQDLARQLKIKISGCPNGCAQHTISNIGFHAAAFSHEGHTIPAYLVSLGGEIKPGSAQIAHSIGKFPARNGVKVIETLLSLYKSERLPAEEFNSFVTRVGDERLKQLLEPQSSVPSLAEDPAFYQDFGHENERFAVRPGVKGECAGSTVAESVPSLDQAREWLAQAEAFIYHKEYGHAMLAAYEATAGAGRVPLYSRLVDPFTADEALWEFENLFVLSGETGGEWQNLSSRFIELKSYEANEAAANGILSESRKFVAYCAAFQPNGPASKAS